MAVTFSVDDRVSSLSLPETIRLFPIRRTINPEGKTVASFVHAMTSPYRTAAIRSNRRDNGVIAARIFSYVFLTDNARVPEV